MTMRTAYGGIAGSGSPGGGLPPGNNEGNLLQWDADTGLWIPVVTPTAEGQGLYWNAALEVWQARDTAGYTHTWGSLNVGNIASGFLSAALFESGGTNVIQTSNVPVAGPVLLTRIAAYWASAGPPSDCTFRVFVGGADSGVSLLSPQAAVGPQEATISLLVPALSFVAIQFNLAGATDAATRRPRFVVRGRSA